MRRHPLLLLVVVLVVSGLIEWFRYLIHSVQYEADPDLWLISAGAVAINLAFHRWILPETLPKVIVSAVFTQAGLPVVAHLLHKVTLLVARELIVSPRPPKVD